MGAAGGGGSTPLVAAGPGTRRRLRVEGELPRAGRGAPQPNCEPESSQHLSCVLPSRPVCFLLMPPREAGSRGSHVPTFTIGATEAQTVSVARRLRRPLPPLVRGRVGCVPPLQPPPPPPWPLGGHRGKLWVGRSWHISNHRQPRCPLAQTLSPFPPLPGGTDLPVGVVTTSSGPLGGLALWVGLLQEGQGVAGHHRSYERFTQSAGGP